MEVVRWMANNGAKNLVLTSRRGIPDRSTWASVDPDSAAAAHIKFIQELEEKDVNVEVAAVDVADFASMSSLISKLATGPKPLAGLIHGAGVMTQGMIAELPVADLEKVFKPKTVGGWILHELTKELNLDFFCLFSSISAAWGSNMLAHYSAANHFLDGLAHYRRSLGLTAVSIDWGLLASGGMSSHDNVEASAAMGLRPLSILEITGIMGHLFGLPEITQRVAVGIDWKKFKKIEQ